MSCESIRFWSGPAAVLVNRESFTQKVAIAVATATVVSVRTPPGHHVENALRPVALITGTSSGIGLAVAVKAARAGYRTVATMRDTAKAGDLLEAAAEAGVRVDVRRLDVVDRDSVAAAVAGVVADHGGLDVVVNNAGQGHVGTVEVDSVEDFRRTMEVNFFGVLHVTKEAMPHLRANRGRLVTVTSVGGVVGQPFNEAYCAAKFAVEGMMESLAPVAATQGVRVVVVEPGAVGSNFLENVSVGSELENGSGEGWRDAAGAAPMPYARALRSYLERSTVGLARAQTPDEVADHVLRVLSSDAPPFRVQTSDAARRLVGLKLVDTDGAAVTGVTAQWLRW
ncbi:SDR family NAD(P)-dependent oxidoreductase [Lentzea sp. NPDC102401]|uniref:SDR family NAD(P)-dependent oxidoreductase n=1 Tax=Lentzea sp. NPDC102401 TaxID=3364128 RepID=UPI003818A7F4